jgi:GntR family transcriptional repressor for pyruvate dehydrogenase complex
MQVERAAKIAAAELVAPNKLPDNSGQQRIALSDYVYHKLFSKIAAGEYSVHQRLPSEHEICQAYNVSRPVVRAALDRLRSDGLVYSRQGSGTFIRVGISQPVVGFGPVGTIGDIQRCYEFRIGFEGEAAFFAAKRANTEAIAEMKAAMAPLKKAAKRQHYDDQADFLFHYAVAQGSNNQYYVQALSALKDHIAIGMKIGGTCLNGSDRAIERVIEEHEAVIRAITDRNPNAAREAMRDHITNSQSRAFEGKELDLSL